MNLRDYSTFHLHLDTNLSKETTCSKKGRECK